MATKALARRRTVYIRRAGSRRRTKPTLSLAILAGLAPTVAFAVEGYRVGGDQGGIVEAAHRVTMRLTGYEWKGNRWYFSQLAMGVGPLLLGGMVHKWAGKSGINRMLKSATMGFISI
jgi:hypothetical protein